MPVKQFDFGDGVPPEQAQSTNEPARPEPAQRTSRVARTDVPTHTSVAGKPRNTIRGFSLILAVVGQALVGSLIASGGSLILGAVTSVAVMSCSAALVATEALASR